MTVSVQLRGIYKSFGRTQALSDVSLDVEGGRIHALVGENGAGKSTLGKILGGLYSPDSGEVMVDGAAVHSNWNVRRAQDQGIVMVAQELSLVPDLTVEQNVFLGVESRFKRIGILRGGDTKRFLAVRARMDFDLDPHTKIRELSIADQQKVEIMRAIARNARAIVFDEPTSSLSGSETDQLHQVMRKLRDAGTAVLYVSHFLDAVLEVSDVVTIMRDGKTVRTASTANESKSTIVEGMIGQSLTSMYPKRNGTPPGADVAPVLEAEGLASNTGVRNATLVARPGEILGLLGLVGSGRTEIARLLYGNDRATGGRLRIAGHDIDLARHRPSGSLRLGLALVPEDRRKQGLVLQRSIKENLSLAYIARFTRLGFLAPKRENDAARHMVADLDVRPPRPELEIGGLSGGNQQKVMLGKSLVGDAGIIILDEPTRGVDVGAKHAIYEIINRMADAGKAVIMISSEHEEVLNLSDRAYLVDRGAIVDEVDPSTLSFRGLLERLFDVGNREEDRVRIE